MKAITEQYTVDDDGDDEWESDKSEDLVEAVINALDLTDFYTGRDHEYVVANLMRAFGTLVDVLAEKKVLEIDDINRIVSTNIHRLEK